MSCQGPSGNTNRCARSSSVDLSSRPKHRVEPTPARTVPSFGAYALERLLKDLTHYGLDLHSKWSSRHREGSKPKGDGADLVLSPTQEWFVPSLEPQRDSPVSPKNVIPERQKAVLEAEKLFTSLFDVLEEAFDLYLYRMDVLLNSRKCGNYLSRLCGAIDHSLPDFFLSPSSSQRSNDQPRNSNSGNLLVKRKSLRNSDAFGRIFRDVAEASMKSYFSSHWNDVDAFVRANRACKRKIRSKYFYPSSSSNSLTDAEDSLGSSQDGIEEGSDSLSPSDSLWRLSANDSDVVGPDTVPSAATETGSLGSSGGDLQGSKAVKEVTDNDFEDMLEASEKHPVLLKYYADYCSFCKLMQPAYLESASELASEAFVCQVNGPENPSMVETMSIEWYPSLVLLIDREVVAEFKSKDRTTEKIVGFVRDTAKAHKEKKEREQNSRGRERSEAFRQSRSLSLTTSSSSLDAHEAGGAGKSSPRLPSKKQLLKRQQTWDWKQLLRSKGIDELDQLDDDRKIVSLQDKIRAMGKPCAQTNPSKVSPRCQILCPHQERQPLVIFLGGGMGSGKSSIMREITSTAFWRDRGNYVVVIEADQIKNNDPLFRILQTVTSSASDIVHNDSTRAAEELLVEAVNKRRDILFDSTMSWLPFVQQTIDMIRDTKHTYARGPGYQKNSRKDSSGNEVEEVLEQYWLPVEARQEETPSYRIEMVAVTVDPEVAVARGINRYLTTGRAVPVSPQLQSHRMFTQNFAGYVEMFDTVYLIDNNETAQPLPLEQWAEGGINEKTANGEEKRSSSSSSDEQPVSEDEEANRDSERNMLSSQTIQKDGEDSSVEEQSGPSLTRMIALSEEGGAVLFDTSSLQSSIPHREVCGSKSLVVSDKDAYQRFLKKSSINIKATKVQELYSGQEKAT